MSGFKQTINGIQEVLAICPCCGEIYRLVEAMFLFPEMKARTCEYLEIVEMERRSLDQQNRITRAEDRFAKNLNQEREKLVDQGRQAAKRKLKKIDPLFSGSRVDPQDVKVVFDPVEYLVFHGLNSVGGVRTIEFVSRAPIDARQESILNSIDSTIGRGDVEFETLRMRDDGSFEIHSD